jgi:hypothetical protein
MFPPLEADDAWIARAGRSRSTVAVVEPPNQASTAMPTAPKSATIFEIPIASPVV